MDRLDEIRERCEKATPGPWKMILHRENYGQGYGATTYFVDMDGALLKIGLAEDAKECTEYYALAQFIVHAHEDIPFLLDEITRLRAELDAANKRADAAVILPCKVGDIVYAIVRCGDIVRDYDDDYNTGTGAVTCPFESDCPFDECDDDDHIRIVATECTNILIDENGICPILDHVNLEISSDSFGETVFLSREEAEKEAQGK